MASAPPAGLQRISQLHANKRNFPFISRNGFQFLPGGRWRDLRISLREGNVRLSRRGVERNVMQVEKWLLLVRIRSSGFSARAYIQDVGSGCVFGLRA